MLYTLCIGYCGIDTQISYLVNKHRTGIAFVAVFMAMLSNEQ